MVTRARAGTARADATRLLLLASTILAGFGTARAQEAPGQPKSAGLTEVVVTAEKRKEDVKEVPISITAVSGDQLKAEHATDMTDLARSLPDVSFSGASGGGAGAGLNNIEIRGISSQAGQATVGLYLDDVSLTTPNTGTLGAPEPKFFDIERIEVLRGPQGTLYGAGSEGGTIRFVSKQPDLDTYGGNVATELSGTDGGGVNWTETGVVNIPLIPGELAVRAGVQIGRKDGYLEQLSPFTGAVVKSNINGEDDLVGKFAIKWKATDALTLEPTLLYQKVRSDDADIQYLDYPGMPGGLTGPMPQDATAKLVSEPGVDRLWVPSLTANYDVGFGDVTSVTSYYWRSFRRVEDGTFSDSLGLGNEVVSPGAVVRPGKNPPDLYTALSLLPSIVDYNNTIAQTSEELRIASKPYDPASGNWPITWVGGVYWSDEITKWTDNEYTPGLNATFASYGLSPAEAAALVGWSGGAGGIPPNDPVNSYTPGSPFPDDINYFSHRHYETRQYSIFGEANYYIDPTLRLTAGIRYLFAREAFDRTAGAYWNSFYVTNTPPPSRSYAATPKFAIDWDVTPEDTIYANASKGFRLGSVNRPVAVDSCIIDGTINGVPSSSCANNLKSYGFTSVPNSYGPDKLWNYEIGDKARLFDNRLSIDAAAFLIEWSNIQQDVFLPQDWDFFTNTGNAEIAGFEWEVRGKVTPELTLGASGSFTHALLTSTGLILAPNGQPYKDAPVEGVPMWNAKLSADYTRPLTDSVDGFIRADWTFTGHSHGTISPGLPDYERPAYSISDASIGADFDAYEVSLFVKNLFNDRTLIQQPNVQAVNEGYRPWPRIIGITASADF